MGLNNSRTKVVKEETKEDDAGEVQTSTSNMPAAKPSYKKIQVRFHPDINKYWGMIPDYVLLSYVAAEITGRDLKERLALSDKMLVRYTREAYNNEEYCKLRKYLTVLTHDSNKEIKPKDVNYCYYITIPDNTKVYVLEGENFIVREFTILDEVDKLYYETHADINPKWCGDNPEAQLKMLEKFPKEILNIQNPSEAMWIQALKGDPTLLKKVKEQTLEMCTIAVNKKPDVLRYAQIQTQEMCIKVLQHDPLLLRYVLEPTEAMQRMAVFANRDTLVFIKDEQLREQLKQELKSQM